MNDHNNNNIIITIIVLRNGPGVPMFQSCPQVTPDFFNLARMCM